MTWVFISLFVFGVYYFIHLWADWKEVRSENDCRDIPSNNGCPPRMEVDELLKLLRVRCDHFVTKKRVYIALGKGLLETQDLYVDLLKGSIQGLSPSDLYSLRETQISSLEIRSREYFNRDYQEYCNRRGYDLSDLITSHYVYSLERGDCSVSNFEDSKGLWIKKENGEWGRFDRIIDFIEDPKDVKSWIEDGGISKLVNEGIAKAIKIQNAVRKLGDLNLTEVSRDAFADYRGITYNR